VESAPTLVAAAPQGYGPTDLASAYNLGTSTATPTVAVVVAYSYAAAESDLAMYRTQFGLPACALASGCLTIVNQSGQASPLPSAAPASDDWTLNAALALDTVSATCPSCKLLLVEANDDVGSGLNLSQATAAHLGATAIVDNFGSLEDSSTSANDAYFDLPGVSIFAQSQSGYDDAMDSGGAAFFPASSEHVIGVSPTNLRHIAAGSRQWTEVVNTFSGSSCSTKIAKPAYQQGVATQCTFRAASDLAAVGDPATSLAVYNAANGGWVQVGGGQAGVAAGIVAAAGRAGVGPAFFYANASALYDITAGTDGTCGNVLCVAGTGWDGPSGNGAPNGQALATTPLPDAGMPEDAGHGAGGAGGAAGAAGSAGAAGANGAAGKGGAGIGGAAGAQGTAGASGTAGAGGASKTGGSSGCGCQITAPGADTAAVVVGLAIAVASLRRRRKR
jgi:MYXO-CTERM domain-containing protein